MIKEVTMYTVICDNCKESADQNTDYSCWNDESAADEVAQNAGWINDENDNDYCDKCFSYNEFDELIIDESRHKLK